MSAEQLTELRSMIGSAPAGRDSRQTNKLFAYLFTGTRGGLTRLRIVMLLLSRPYNANQLAIDIGIDYKAIRHHVRILEQNSLVCRDGARYGTTYRASGLLEANVHALSGVIDKIEARMGRKKVYY